MSQNLNDRPDRSPVLIGHCGNSAIMKQMLVLGIMEVMKSPGGQILVGCDPARPGDETVAGIISRNLDHEFVYHLHDRPRGQARRVRIDESGPWPPVPVDDVPHYYSKESQERLAKAQAKRQRKNLKRLKDAGRV